MPSTYTQNLGVEKPGTGEQTGTWGDTANRNFDVFDRAINGVVTLSLSGTSSTLTTTDGALSDGQYKILALAGTPSGAHTITISPSDAQKLYFVLNTSGQSVIFTQGSGGNVTIANGDTKIIYSDGAGAGAAVVDVTAQLAMSSPNITGGSITGITDLAVADGGTGVSTLTGIVKGNGTSAFSAAVAGTDYQVPITGGASSITTTDLTASRALVSDGSGKVAVSGTVTSTELGYIGTLTSDAQTQLDAKAPAASPSFSGTITITGGTNNWTAVASGTTLTFSYNGVARMQLDGSNGNLVVTGDVTAFGTL